MVTMGHSWWELTQIGHNRGECDLLVYGPCSDPDWRLWWWWYSAYDCWLVVEVLISNDFTMLFWIIGPRYILIPPINPSIPPWQLTLICHQWLPNMSCLMPQEDGLLHQPHCWPLTLTCDLLPCPWPFTFYFSMTLSTGLTHNLSPPWLAEEALNIKI